jgi:hypothetical protein
MSRDHEGAGEVGAGLGQELVDESEAGNVASFSGGAAVARKVGEDALVADPDESLEDGRIAVDEIALAVEENEPAPGLGNGLENEAMEMFAAESHVMLFHSHPANVFMSSWIKVASSGRLAL